MYFLLNEQNLYLPFSFIFNNIINSNRALPTFTNIFRLPTFNLINKILYSNTCGEQFQTMNRFKGNDSI